MQLPCEVSVCRKAVSRFVAECDRNSRKRTRSRWKGCRQPPLDGRYDAPGVLAAVGETEDHLAVLVGLKVEVASEVYGLRVRGRLRKTDPNSYSVRRGKVQRVAFNASDVTSVRAICCRPDGSAVVTIRLGLLGARP